MITVASGIQCPSTTLQLRNEHFTWGSISIIFWRASAMTMLGIHVYRSRIEDSKANASFDYCCWKGQRISKATVMIIVKDILGFQGMEAWELCFDSRLISSECKLLIPSLPSFVQITRQIILALVNLFRKSSPSASPDTCL